MVEITSLHNAHSLCFSCRTHLARPFVPSFVPYGLSRISINNNNNSNNSVSFSSFLSHRISSNRSILSKMEGQCRHQVGADWTQPSKEGKHLTGLRVNNSMTGGKAEFIPQVNTLKYKFEPLE